MSYLEEINKAGFWKGIFWGVLIGFFMGAVPWFGSGIALTKWKMFVKTNDRVIDIYQEVYNYLPKKKPVTKEEIK